MSNEPNKIIYSMIGVSKYYDKKPVLKDIYLSYFYGAKIGVLGLNGSGKSTLLRIIAGVDTGYIGELAISKGYTVGLLEQDPQLDPAKTVIEIVREGVQPIVDLLARYDAVCERFGDAGADMDALLAEQARLQEGIGKHGAWNLDNPPEPVSLTFFSGWSGASCSSRPIV